MKTKLLCVSFLSFLCCVVYGQTTITTNHPNNNGNGSVIFNVQNTNAFDIIITSVQCHLGTTATNNIELLYRTTPFVDNAAPWDFGTVGAGQNGWISAATGFVSNTNTANGIVPALTFISLTIPAGATYQLGLSATTMQYSSLVSGAGINTFSGGGVNLLTGDGISWGGTVYPVIPGNYPRALIGGITFIPAVPCTSPPTAGAVSAANNPICPSVNNTLVLTGGTGGTGQTYQWQSSATGAVGSYTNIPGATNSAFISNQTTDTYYRCYVTCSGLSDTTAGFLVSTTNFINCYCTSNATSTSDEEIFNVTFGLLNNSSTCGSTGGPGSIQNQYSNYTTLPATSFSQNANYPLSVEVGTCGGNYNNMTKVYIDYNHNGLFTDPGEEVYASSVSNLGPHFETGSILIPMASTTGITRMRVITVETTVIGNITPCGTYNWGETEDYFINIIPPPTCPQPNAFTVMDATDTAVALSWVAGGAETSWLIQYGPPGFVLGTGDSVITTSNPDTITGLVPNSFYQAYIMAICSSTDSSFYSGPVSFNTYNQGSYMDWLEGCSPVGFIDISTTGTGLGLADEGESGMSLPFPVYYQGTLVTDCTIGSNGGIALGTTIANVGYGGNMASQVGNYIFPWGDDLDNETGNVYQQTIGTAPNRIFIVQWDSICNFPGIAGAPTVTFQVQFEEATHKIWFVYDDVVFGPPNESDDYAGNADIGVSGPNQDLNVSNDNMNYLQNNSCVEFYYTNCPRPQNFTTTHITAVEIQFGWTAGLSNETNWIIEYGPTGFTPGTGTIYNETNNNSLIAGLIQLTDYTIYIYANCANGDTSYGMVHHFTTLPYCSTPTSLTGSSLPDSLSLTWSWTESDPTYPISSFNIQYNMTGSAASTIVVANGTDLADTAYGANLMGSGVYEVYVQAVCTTGDTSFYSEPVTIIMPATNDSVCGEELLALGNTYTFNNNDATVELNEASIAPPATGFQTTTGWENSTLDGTLWYIFVAPPSGSVRINSTAINYDGQAAVYSATDCADFNTFTFIAANDDDISSSSVAPNFTVCGLTPGNTYYLLYDKFDATAGNFSLNITEIILESGTANATTNVCYGETVNLYTSINGYDPNGTWSSDVPVVNISILNDSLLNTNGLAYQTFDVQYMVTEGCAYDSVISQVTIFAPSSAGDDGTINACRNQPINLLSGLNGNVDLGGDWYNPLNVLLSSASFTTGNIPGNYTYMYIAGNGVCEDDTALVELTVTNCDFSSIAENTLDEINIYPNPSTGSVFIESTFETGTYNLMVTDINGRIIQTTINSLSTGVNLINLNEVQKGVYIFKISNENTQKVFRVVIQ
jgi:hypothetical protein